MDAYRTAHLPLAELVAAVRALSARGGALPTEGADERTIRYWQTLGIVDRPLRYEGRTALYAWRHLLQVLAIRVLQAEGCTLAQIQRALAGRTNDELAAAVGPAIGMSPAPPVPVAPRALRAVEVAPGIHVTIDPLLVPDADEAIALISALFPSNRGVR